MCLFNRLFLIPINVSLFTSVYLFVQSLDMKFVTFAMLFATCSAFQIPIRTYDQEWVKLMQVCRRPLVEYIISYNEVREKTNGVSREGIVLEKCMSQAKLLQTKYVNIEVDNERSYEACFDIPVCIKTKK
nr:PREDICTED: uncharacterized protein LOC107398314 [Tribolium castaneum]|eukprot:XP_015837508.1 PREDICTED: uncharacterized protein LOC107398314 [Tribolium castaneum]